MADFDPETVIGFAAIPHRLCQDPDLNHSTYRLMGALMFFFRGHTVCNPSNADLSRSGGGLSLDAINRGLKDLEARGVVAVERPSARSRGPISLLLPPDLGGVPHASDARRSIPKFRKEHPEKKDGHPEIQEGHPEIQYPPTPPYMEGRKEETNTESVPVTLREKAEALEGWQPGDGERLEALADRLFPMAEFGRRIVENAHLFPAEYFERALEAAVMGGKRVGFPYILGICRSYARSGGPPPADRSGVGVRPKSQATPIPDYVTPPPEGYRKSYTPAPKGAKKP